MKIGQNNSHGQKLSETTNQGVEIMKIMNSKRQLKNTCLSILTNYEQ